jgi:hypothetical protein
MRKRLDKQPRKADKVVSSDRYGRGVVLIATGHPYYAHMAFNLLCSLKVQSPELEVALIKSGNSIDQLSKDQTAMFDRIIEASPEMLTGVYGNDPLKLKLHINELTPFNNTLYLDVDMIWSPTKSVSDLINKLSGTSFAIANRGRVSENEAMKSQWVSVGHLKEQLGITSCYDLSSEVMYFEPNGDKVFDHARKIYDSGILEVKDFAGGKPDEVFLACALELERVTLEESPWYPTYWQPHYFSERKKVYMDDEIRDGFYALSSGGAFIAKNVKRLYDMWASHYHYQMGLKRQPYKLMPKSMGVPFRTKI